MKSILLQDTQINMREFYKKHPFKFKGEKHLINYKLLYHRQANCIDIDKRGRLAFEQNHLPVEKAKKKHIITACMSGNELITWCKPTKKQIITIKQMYDLGIINEKALLCL